MCRARAEGGRRCDGANCAPSTREERRLRRNVRQRAARRAKTPSSRAPYRIGDNTDRDAELATERRATAHQSDVEVAAVNATVAVTAVEERRARAEAGRRQQSEKAAHDAVRVFQTLNARIRQLLAAAI